MVKLNSLPVISFTSRYPCELTGGIESVVGKLVPLLTAMHPEWNIRSVYAFRRPNRFNRIPFLGDICAGLVLYLRTRTDTLTLVNGAEYAWPRLWRHLMRKSSVVVWHGTRDFEIQALSPRQGVLLRIYATLEHLIVKRAVLASAHIAVSPRVVEEIRHAYAYKEDVTVIVNGAPELNFGYRRNVSLAPSILWIGTNAYKKGFDVAFEAAQIVREKIPNLQFHVAGLETLPISSVPDWVITHGAITRERMMQLYGLAHVTCFTTRYEGCSVAILEAVACKVPSVASEAVAWMFGNEEIACFNSQEFAARMLALLLSKEKAEEVVRRQASMLERFDWTLAASQYSKIISERLREVA